MKSEIELDLHFMVSDLVYKFQMICLRGTQVIEQKPNSGIMDTLPRLQPSPQFLL